MVTKTVLLSPSKSQRCAFSPLKPYAASTQAQIVAALPHAGKTTLWISGSSQMTAKLLKSLSWPRARLGRALLLSKPTSETLVTLAECFERIAVVDVTLPPEELAEALAAKNRADLFVGGLVDHSSEMVTLLRGNLETLAVPFSAFPTSGDGIIPSFDEFAVTDSGQTVCFGEYEAASDAILDEYSPEYRQRRLKEQRAAKRFRNMLAKKLPVAAHRLGTA